jgi:gluconate 2-dehydrogenase alpha chain
MAAWKMIGFPGARYDYRDWVDARGREWEQPAEMVFLCAFQMFNVQLLLLSGIGQPYDVTTGQGVIGRNYSYQVTSSVEAFFDNKIFNPFIASGAIGMCIDDYNGDNFEHGPYGFVGGGYMGMVQPNARPIEVTPTPPGTPQWGAAWKKAVKDNYLSTILPAAHGSCYSYRDCYLDLDPTYKDRFGRPLMRLTFDFHENELKMSQFLTDRLAEIVQKMGRARSSSFRAPAIIPSCRTRRRTPAAARSLAPTRRPARSTAICRAGACTICS